MRFLALLLPMMIGAGAWSAELPSGNVYEVEQRVKDFLQQRPECSEQVVDTKNCLFKVSRLADEIMKLNLEEYKHIIFTIARLWEQSPSSAYYLATQLQENWDYNYILLPSVKNRKSQRMGAQLGALAGMGVAVLTLSKGPWYLKNAATALPAAGVIAGSEIAKELNSAPPSPASLLSLRVRQQADPDQINGQDAIDQILKTTASLGATVWVSRLEKVRSVVQWGGRFRRLGALGEVAVAGLVAGYLVDHTLETGIHTLRMEDLISDLGQVRDALVCKHPESFSAAGVGVRCTNVDTSPSDEVLVFNFVEKTKLIYRFVALSLIRELQQFADRMADFNGEIDGYFATYKNKENSPEGQRARENLRSRRQKILDDLKTKANNELRLGPYGAYCQNVVELYRLLKSSTEDSIYDLDARLKTSGKGALHAWKLLQATDKNGLRYELDKREKVLLQEFLRGQACENNFYLLLQYQVFMKQLEATVPAAALAKEKFDKTAIALEYFYLRLNQNADVADDSRFEPRSLPSVQSLNPSDFATKE